MSSWNSYGSIYALSHRAARRLMEVDVLVQEKVDGCVTLDTPVLKADLTWVPAGSLQVGDKLIGTEYTGKRLRLCHSIVTVAQPIRKPCVKITTDKTTVIASHDHPFWVRKITTNTPSRWLQAKDLQTGLSIPYIPPWQADNSREGGYLAGQFDGEGSLVKHGKYQRILSYYQKISPSQRYVRELLCAKGFDLREDVRQRKAHYAEMWMASIAGGWGEILRFLGSIRPVRLLEKAERCWVGGAINGLAKATVLAVEDAGEQMVMGLSTSSETYWAGGLASHNSQFSFGLIDGELRCRSKGQEIFLDAPDKMFGKAVEMVKALRTAGKLVPGWTYRGEYLQKPKHNALAYDRAPNGHVILFDIAIGEEQYLEPAELADAAQALSLECVPTIYTGPFSPDLLAGWMDRISILGGQKIEGVVIKPLTAELYGVDKKRLMAKHVSHEFKEVHASEWKLANPGRSDIVAAIISALRTPARWDKGIQHLNERGELENSPRDIGKLIKEVQVDLSKEMKEEVAEKLLAHFWPQIVRGATAGLPEYYKAKLDTIDQRRLAQCGISGQKSNISEPHHP